MDVANFTNALTPMTRVSILPNVFINILTNPLFSLLSKATRFRVSTALPVLRNA